MSEQHQIEALLRVYFALDDDQLQPVLDEFQRVALTGGDWLFRQGESGDSLYFLVRGRMQAWVQGADEKPRLLGEIAPGEPVGDVGLLTGEARTAGIKATRDCTLLRIDRAGLDRLTARFPQMALQLARGIAMRLHQRTSRRAERAPMVNICLLPLAPTPASLAFIDALADALGALDTSCELSIDRLAAAGAPVGDWRNDGPIPADLAAWLAEQETEHRFVIYRCPADGSPWSAFACRQADLVLMIGDARLAPIISDWERRLRSEQGDSPSRQALVLLHANPEHPIAGTAAWLDQRPVDFHLHHRAGSRADLARIARVVSGRAIGLVFGSGAARGFAHIGVYRALVEAGIPIDWVGGSSIGAIVAGAIAHDWTPDQVRDLARDAFVGHNPFKDLTLPLISLLAGKKMMRLCRRMLDRNIEDLPLPYFCISANLDNGSLNLHTRGPLYLAVQAAAALPGALPPAVVNGRLAIDGAVINSLPVDLMRQFPVGKVIAVDISARREVKVDYPAMPTPWALLRSRLLPFGRRYRTPGLVTILLKATEVGTMEKMDRMGALADLLIQPEVRRFGMTEVKRFDQVVDAGYQAARERLHDWQPDSP